MSAMLFAQLALLASPPTAAAPSVDPAAPGTHGPLPAEVRTLMQQYSWRAGCPVPLEDLAYLRLPLVGYDGKVHRGELVVHARVADDVVKIFDALFAARFPIEKMRLVDHYQGSDDRSMADNNTSAFNCRPVVGRTDVYSNHSFGLAIDVNPLTNPYVTKKGNVSPPGGAAYTDRTLQRPGLIVASDACHAAFLTRGWTWGGAWKGTKDYQHFEIKLDVNRTTKAIPSPR